MTILDTTIEMRAFLEISDMKQKIYQTEPKADQMKDSKCKE
mgnify:FL=1